MDTTRLHFHPGDFRNPERRIHFLRYSGDSTILSTLILIAGAALCILTLSLLSQIKFAYTDSYYEYFVTWGIVSAPIFSTYLIQTNPELVQKVSPATAKVFTPLVLITLLLYLIAVALTGKDPYNDRGFLLTFNILLICVMAIVIFSVTETSRQAGNRISVILLLALSVLTILVNGVALSAILFRISEWGLTPNRIVVLGANLLILGNLLLVSYHLFRSVREPEQLRQVENTVASYLPIYGLWTGFVTFLLPVLFWFK